MSKILNTLFTNQDIKCNKQVKYCSTVLVQGATN